MRTRAWAANLAVILTLGLYAAGPLWADDAAKGAAYKMEPGPFRVQTIKELVLRDEKRKKDLQLRINYPDGKGPFPVIVWSHGMFGSKDGYQPLIQHWVQHGYIVIQPTHSDSLSLLSPEERRKALANLKPDRIEDWMNRPRDVQFVLDSLDAIVKKVPELAERMDRKRIGMGGHSFGAFTTQLVAGTSVLLPGGKRQSFTDARPAAFVAISPNGSGPLFDKESFKETKGPTLFVSGTNDRGRKGEEAGWRKEAFDHASAGEKHLAWVEGAHHGFGGISDAPAAFRKIAESLKLGGEENPKHVELVRITTLAFWDAYLKDSKEARAYLESDKLPAFSKGTLKLEHK
jgi:predicted dienelactone hydrolase